MMIASSSPSLMSPPRPDLAATPVIEDWAGLMNFTPEEMAAVAGALQPLGLSHAKGLLPVMLELAERRRQGESTIFMVVEHGQTGLSMALSPAELVAGVNDGDPEALGRLRLPGGQSAGVRDVLRRSLQAPRDDGLTALQRMDATLAALARAAAGAPAPPPPPATPPGLLQLIRQFEPAVPQPEEIGVTFVALPARQPGRGALNLLA